MVNMTLFQIQLLVAIRLDVNAATHIVNLCGAIVQMKQLKLGTGGLTMAKYIDREGLVEWLKRIPLKDLSDGLGLCRIIMEDDFKKAIKKMPKGIIVDVAPVRHGRWLTWEEQFPGSTPKKQSGLGVFCDKCHSHADNRTDYCPNCGADMRGSNDE